MSHPADGKTIRDPVHGDIRIVAEDLPLVDSRALQRLRGVRQLGSAFHVYPGAQHTRFEHALGTYHMAQVLTERIRANHERDPASCRDITPREAAVIRVVGLLHDVTHIPHGHAVEDQDGLFPRHDEPEFLRRVVSTGDLGRLLRARRLVEPVAAHLTEKGAADSATPFLSLVVNGPVGADMLDYLRRDSYFTGLRIDYDDRLLDYVKIDPKTGIVYVDLVKHDMDREDILTEVLNLLHGRYVSSERIYYHHAKVASGVLVSRAVELAIQGGLTREDVAEATESSLLTLLRNKTYEAHPLGDGAAVQRSIGALLDRYEERRLLKRCFVASRRGNEKRQEALVKAFVQDSTERRALEREIAEALQIEDPALVIIYCPRPAMQLKEAAVPVRRARRGIKPLSTYTEEFPALKQIVEAYRDLWKLYVFVPARDRDHLVWAGKKVERILGRRFPGIANQYRP